MACSYFYKADCVAFIEGELFDVFASVGLLHH